MSKKKMYYNMRVKTLKRNKADLLLRLETEKESLQIDAKNRIHKLYSAVKDVCIYSCTCWLHAAGQMLFLFDCAVPL